MECALTTDGTFSDIAEMNTMQDITGDLSKDFNKIEFSCVLTHHCNWRCSYCCQEVDHSIDDRIPFKNFKLLITKIFFEIKKNNIKEVTFSVLGGELSTDMIYIDYVKEIVLAAAKLNIPLNIDFITNLSGELEFFWELNELQKLHNGLRLGVTATMHEEYYQKDSLVFKFIQKLKAIDNFNNPMEIDLKFLNSNNPKYKMMRTFFKKYQAEVDAIDNIRIEIDPLLKKGINKAGDFGLEMNDQPTRYCNALVYDIKGTKITDRCKGRRFNFINFKIDRNWYKCSKACPCAFMVKDFIQIPEEDFIDIS